MTLYVVEASDYNDHWIESVWDIEEAANQRCAVCNQFAARKRRNYPEYDFRVEPVELNTPSYYAKESK